MLAKLIKLVAYTRAPKLTFSLLHPVKAAQVAKTPFDLRTAYAPRLVAVATALVVAPIAYRIGKRVGAGSLRAPSPHPLPGRASTVPRPSLEPPRSEGP